MLEVRVQDNLKPLDVDAGKDVHCVAAKDKYARFKAGFTHDIKGAAEKRLSVNWEKLLGLSQAA